ncbi:MAG: tail fiber domain-containing protein, partial [Bacteroidales bacterium]|nr:tail fiber domain-containing protein [Bacteroidales bacterium]
KYQAIARDNLGNLITDQDVGLRISILQGSVNGTVVYSEAHLAHTNQFGLFNIGIGQGGVLSGNFSAISWGAKVYFIKTEMDTSGGTSYSLMGTSQLMSVPYALYSENTANVNDADADPVNELQSLSVSGSNLSISSGNTVTLPDELPSGALGSTLYHNGSSWTSGNNLFNDGSNIGVGTTVPTVVLDVTKPVSGGVLSLFRNTSTGSGSTAIKTEATYDTRAYLGVQGSTDFDGITGLGLSGDEIGVLGTSLGTSDYDNYGIYGYSNGIGVYGENSISGRSGHLGGDLYGVYGQRTSDRFGYLGGVFGAYGQYSSNKYGFLGGAVWGAYGQYNSTNYGYLGSSSCGAYGESSTSNQGYGGYFKNTSSGGNNYGVYVSSEYTGNFDPPYSTTGLYVNSTSTTQHQTGIHNYVNHTGSTGSVHGQFNYIDVASGNQNLVFGISISIHRDDDQFNTYGLSVDANNGTNVYGIKSWGSGGSNTNYAGYFSGNLAYTGSLIHISDRKFKENLRSIDGSLDKIKKLNTYSFTFKTTAEAEKINFDKGRQFGFIAQELEALFPELVSDNVHPLNENISEEDKKVKKDGGIEYKGVNYIGMIPILTEAIKEQQEIIEDQQQQIDELRLMVSQLME